jgi:hypothetical protein
MWILTERAMDRDLYFGPFETYGKAGEYRVKRGLAATKIEPLIEIEPETDRAAEEGARAVEEELRRPVPPDGPPAPLRPPFTSVRGSPDAFRG